LGGGTEGLTYCGSPITSTSFTYDKNGNVLQTQNQNATVTYIYDARNRILNETYAVNLSTRLVIDLGRFGGGGTSTVQGGVAKTYVVGSLTT
jgi:YD repeat-containing protein